MSPAQALCSPVFAVAGLLGARRVPGGFRGGSFVVTVVVSEIEGEAVVIVVEPAANTRGQPSRRDCRHPGIGRTPGGCGQSGLAPYCTSETLPFMKITFISL